MKWAGSRDKIFSPSGRGRTFFLTSLFIELIDRVVSVIAFHEKAGRSQVGFVLVFVGQGFFSAESATVATLPSALFDERFCRSVQVGCSRFSRCCHLIIDLSFHLEHEKLGQAINAVTGTRRLGFGLSFLRMFLLYAAAGIAMRLLLCNGSYTSPLTHR